MTLTVNTNLSSLIAQNSLAKSTNGLNSAIEKLTTGFKINSSSDDAAGYSIVNDMTTKISAWEVAESNTSMGIDLLTTASDTIAQMQSNAERLQALCIQARNGTYGDTSIEAIQAEANARVAEIARIYTSTEYNGINLLDKVSAILKQKGLDTVAQKAGLTTDITASKGPNGKFIDDVVEETPDIVVSTPDELASAISSKTKIGIANAETLAKLATLVNSGTRCSGKTIILTEDIDLSSYSTGTGWTPIGNTYDSSKSFNGIFDGNGHSISNMKINSSSSCIGLFMSANGATIRNVGIINADITGLDNTGVLIGISGFENPCTIENCYTTGNISGSSAQVGGLIGFDYNSSNKTKDCYSSVSITGTSSASGGLVGVIKGSVENCYASGNIAPTGCAIGGLAGKIEGNGSCINCYATGNVTGSSYDCGGLVGRADNSITNCYATGNVTSSRYQIGGLVGRSYGNITNSVSFAKSVSGTTNVGSLVGYISSSYTISDCNCVSIDGLKKIGSGGTEDQNKGISYINLDTNIQVGIFGDDNSRIKFDTSFSYNLSAVLSDISSDSALNSIQTFMDTLSTKSTELGAVTNRLSSAIDNISTSYENLVSSRSTLRDTDVAKESSEYIKQQILQQASATLLSTANQSPSIVLSLI